MEDLPSFSNALSGALSSEPTRLAVRVVVDRAHRMACAYLRQKQQSGRLRADVLGEDVEDLAIDAIAGLFEQSDDGQFPELQRYFADEEVTEMSPSALEREFRRLVMGTVTDWRFEAYRTADRSLSNLLRVLKRVAKKRKDVRLQRRGGRLWLLPETGSPPDDTKTSSSSVGTSSASAASVNGTTAEGSSPEERAGSSARRMPMDVLESHLTGAVAEASSTADLLSAAVRTLRRHPTYDVGYPLTKLAQVIRSAQVRVQAVTDHESPVSTPSSPPLRPEETEEFLEQCIEEIREAKRSTYVETGKVEAATYRAYICALRTRLRARFVPKTEDYTHYEALSAHLSSLSKEEYREVHRARFEYLVRQAEEKLTEHLRRLPR